MYVYEFSININDAILLIVSVFTKAQRSFHASRDVNKCYVLYLATFDAREKNMTFGNNPVITQKLVFANVTWLDVT